MQTSGEISAAVTVLGSVISFMGITGIDANVISNAANGIVALFTIGFAIFAYFKHRNAVVSSQ